MNVGTIESGKVKVKILTANSTSITLLTDEKFQGKVIQPEAEGIRATGEHGLAMSIEVMDGDLPHYYLLDTGNVTSTIMENRKVFKVNLGAIEKLIISHGHFDHFGALIKVIPELKEGCEIILNPDCYLQTHVIGFKQGKEVSVEEIGTSLRTLVKEGIIRMHKKFPLLNKTMITKVSTENNVKILETTKPQELHKGIITSGEIELFNKNEITKGLYIERSRNKFENYSARDETSLFINVKDKGLVILTGCGHVGIMNTIKHAQKLTGINKVYAIIGGFHKINQPIEQIEDTIKFIEDINPEITCGMHCTGFEFNKRMSLRGHPSHTLGVTGTEFQL